MKKMKIRGIAQVAMGLLLSVLPGMGTVLAEQFWDPYGFVAPYAGRRFGVTGDQSDAWKGGVRVGRVGWLTGWGGDLAAERGEEDAPDRLQASLDGYFKPIESGKSAVILSVGMGASRIEPAGEEKSHTFFHYRYGFAYRLRFSERYGVRIDLTALRSRAGEFSSREATWGWIVYF